MLHDPQSATAAVGGIESGGWGIVDEGAGAADEVYFEEPEGGDVGCVYYDEGEI